QVLHVRWLVRYRLSDDDLVFGVDGGLTVVALHEAVAALHDPALGIGEIALRLRSRRSVLRSRHLVRRQRRRPRWRRIAVVFLHGLLRFVLRTRLGLERSLQLVDPCEAILGAPKIFR